LSQSSDKPIPVSVKIANNNLVEFSKDATLLKSYQSFKPHHFTHDHTVASFIYTHQPFKKISYTTLVITRYTNVYLW